MKIQSDPQTIKRRQVATARFMLRVIDAEQAHGIHRSDAEAFKARMEAQAKGESSIARFMGPRRR